MFTDYAHAVDDCDTNDDGDDDEDGDDGDHDVMMVAERCTYLPVNMRQAEDYSNCSRYVASGHLFSRNLKEGVGAHAGLTGFKPARIISRISMAFPLC